MLKLTIKQGEYICIGDEIRVIFSGGSANNMHILIDAPREYNIVRNKVLEKSLPDKEKEKLPIYYKEDGLSDEAKEEIRKIIVADKKKKGNNQRTNLGVRGIL